LSFPRTSDDYDLFLQALNFLPVGQSKRSIELDKPKISQICVNYREIRPFCHFFASCSDRTLRSKRQESGKAESQNMFEVLGSSSPNEGANRGNFKPPNFAETKTGRITEVIRPVILKAVT